MLDTIGRPGLLRTLTRKYQTKMGNEQDAGKKKTSKRTKTEQLSDRKLRQGKAENRNTKYKNDINDHLVSRRHNRRNSHQCSFFHNRIICWLAVREGAAKLGPPCLKNGRTEETYRWWRLPNRGRKALPAGNPHKLRDFTLLRPNLS